MQIFILQYYNVGPEFYSQSLLKMDRSATCLFGIQKYGVDINGFVRHPTLGLCLWLQKRAANKETWPGMVFLLFISLKMHAKKT